MSRGGTWRRTGARFPAGAASCMVNAQAVVAACPADGADIAVAGHRYPDVATGLGYTAVRRRAPLDRSSGDDGRRHIAPCDACVHGGYPDEPRSVAASRRGDI